MPIAPVPIEPPARCVTCGQVPPLPAVPEVERWAGIAQGLVRESRSAYASGNAKRAAEYRVRATSALLKAVDAQVDAEMSAGRS